MLTGTLSPVSNKADWIDAYELKDDETGEAIDISEAQEIVVAVREVDTKSVVLEASLSGGTITHVDTGTFQWNFTRDQMSGLCARTYDVGLTIKQDDETIQLFIGYVPVLDGVVR